MKKAAISIALVAVSVAIGALMLEFGVRILMPQFDPSGQIRFELMADGTPIGPAGASLRQTKNTGDFDVSIAFNALGFRDDKNLAKSDANSIFVVGDSFSFGWGVEQSERYSDVLQKLSGREVFNISIPTDVDGYAHLLAYAKRSGANVGTLIIGLCLENDIWDYDAPKAPAATPPASAPISVQAIKNWMHDHSALYFFLTSIIHTNDWLRGLFVDAGMITPNLEGIAPPELDAKAVRSTAAHVAALAAGQPTIVLIIPSRWLWVGDPARSKAVSESHVALVADLRERGVRVIDPRDYMERNGPPLKYHFMNDGHWRASMHRIAAEMLDEALGQPTAR